MKKNNEELPLLVRCYGCQSQSLQHLYLIEETYPFKLASNTIGNIVRANGTSVPAVRRITETIHLCKPHFEIVILAKKFKPLGLRHNNKLYRFDELTNQLVEVK